MPEKRIFAKAGHVCMMCGFKATTKNKYRELQDHLVRRHFQDRIKAALPTRRPLCVLIIVVMLKVIQGPPLHSVKS